MSTTIPYDETETTGAREAFLELREVVGLPRGGEVVLKEELMKVADAAGIDYSRGWSKERIMWNLTHVYRTPRHDTFRERLRDLRENYHGPGRDYNYMTANEARKLTAHIRERQEALDEWEWGPRD